MRFKVYNTTHTYAILWVSVFVSIYVCVLHSCCLLIETRDMSHLPKLLFGMKVNSRIVVSGHIGAGNHTRFPSYNGMSFNYGIFCPSLELALIAIINQLYSCWILIWIIPYSHHFPLYIHSVSLLFIFGFVLWSTKFIMTVLFLIHCNSFLIHLIPQKYLFLIHFYESYKLLPV